MNMAITSVTHTTVDAIRDQILEDERRMLVAAGVSRPGLAKGSERYIRAEATAAVVMGVVAKEVALQDAQMPDSAMDEDLTRLCELAGVTISTGAGAGGYVIAEVTGTVVYVEGQECTSPDGMRYQVIATTVATDTTVPGTLVPILGVDTGTKTNKPAGTVMTWTSPPSGSAPTAKVDVDGLRFGVEADNNDTLRVKLLESERHPAIGGNSSHVAKDAQDASKAIEKAFVYPASTGPSTMTIALVAPAVAEYAYTRVVSGALSLAAAANVISQHPEHADLTLVSAANYDVDLILTVTLPEPREGGGIGGGWRDKSTTRWPAGTGSGTPAVVTIENAPTNGLSVTMSSETVPVAGAYIALWSSLKKKVVRTRVLDATDLGGGTYRVRLYTPIDTTWFQTTGGTWGDFVMPDAERIEEYCATIAGAFASLGPGEITSNVLLLPRAKRRPYTQESYSCDFSSAHMGALSAKHPEMTNVIMYGAYRSSNNTVFSSFPPIACPVTSPPSVLRIGRLAVYPMS